MISNYAKYIFYTIFITTAISLGFFVKNTLLRWKDDAVKAALEEVKTQQKDITIGQQDNVIKQAAIVFKKSQQIIEESAKIEKEIASANTVSDMVKVKHSIIEEINCCITNFSDDSICVKS